MAINRPRQFKQLADRLPPELISQLTLERSVARHYG
jgi:hypothetical protein